MSLVSITLDACGDHMSSYCQSVEDIQKDQATWKLRMVSVIVPKNKVLALVVKSFIKFKAKSLLQQE